MKLSSIAVAMFSLAVVSNSFGQESSRKDFKELCKALEGRFVGEVTWVADWPGLGKKGDKVTCYFEGRLTEDGNAIAGKWFGGNGSGTGLYYYDAGARQIKCLWVNSGGAFGQAVLYKEKDHWIEKGTGALADGRKTSHTSTLTITDDGNTHTYRGPGTVGDEKTDDRHDIYRRVSK